MNASYAHSMDMALKNLSNGAIAILLGAVTVGVTVVGVVMTIATSQMFALTGRIDTLYSDAATARADIARTATTTEYMKQELVEIKTTLKEMSSTLITIDKRLAAAGGPQPTNYVVVKDPELLWKVLSGEKLPGPIFVQSPDPKTNQFLQDHLQR